MVSIGGDQLSVPCCGALGKFHTSLISESELTELGRDTNDVPISRKRVRRRAVQGIDFAALKIASNEIRFADLPSLLWASPDPDCAQINEVAANISARIDMVVTI